MRLASFAVGFGLAALIGCGGTVTRLDDGVGSPAGAGGTSAAAGSLHSGGYAGTSIEKGGAAPYGGGYAGTSYGGDIAYGGIGGTVSYGGDGASAGDISYAGEAGSSSCDPPAMPYPVSFTYSSPYYPVYLRRTCGPSFQLYKDDSTTPLRTDAACTADCSDQSLDCVACGPCAISAQAIEPNSLITDLWNGEIYTSGQLPSGCPCATASPACAGNYTVSVDVYPTAASAMSGTGGMVQTFRFTLPAPNNAVTLDIGLIPL